MIKAILFDLWNTLVYDKSNAKPFDKTMRLFEQAGSRNPHETFDKYVCLREFSNHEEAAQFVSRKTGCDKNDILEVFKEYEDEGSTFFKDVVPALKELRKRYKLAIISNMSSIGLKAVQRIGLEQLVDYTFYSFKLGLIKQDQRMFRHALKEMGVKPHEAMMIGDNKEADIDAAERVGIKAVLIKREGYPISYKEKKTFKRTIKTLDELDRYLKF